MDHSGPMGLFKGHCQMASLPAVSTSLHDGNGGFRSLNVMLDADEMWMPNMRTGIMYSSYVVISLDVQGTRMWGRNGGLLGDEMRVVDLL